MTIVHTWRRVGLMSCKAIYRSEGALQAAPQLKWGHVTRQCR
jgi:hypothetical protein